MPHMSSHTQVPDYRTTLRGGGSRLVSHSLSLTFDAQGLHNHPLEQVQNMLLHPAHVNTVRYSVSLLYSTHGHTTHYYTLVLGTSDTQHIHICVCNSMSIQ